MNTFKKYTRLIVCLGLLGWGIYKFADYLYYSSFKGNDKIKFISVDTAGLRTYGDLFKSDQLKGKVTFVDLYFYANNQDYAVDLPYFKKLYDRFANQPFQIVYTNSSLENSFRNAEHKKIIKQNDVEGYHITVPLYLESTAEVEFVKDGKRVTTFPKYMLVNKDGTIADTFACRPANFERLCKQIDSLLLQ